MKIPTLALLTILAVIGCSHPVTTDADTGYGSVTTLLRPEPDGVYVVGQVPMATSKLEAYLCWDGQTLISPVDVPVRFSSSTAKTFTVAFMFPSENLSPAEQDAYMKATMAERLKMLRSYQKDLSIVFRAYQDDADVGP